MPKRTSTRMREPVQSKLQNKFILKGKEEHFSYTALTQKNWTFWTFAKLKLASKFLLLPPRVSRDLGHQWMNHSPVFSIVASKTLRRVVYI